MISGLIRFVFSLDAGAFEEPPEVDGGGVALLLTSEAGHYLTGETLNVNGGLYMRP